MALDGTYSQQLNEIGSTKIEKLVIKTQYISDCKSIFKSTIYIDIIYSV
jgi:hypothetical protein